MSVEGEFSEGEDHKVLDSCEIKRNMLYRREQDGILVYDSLARISDEPITQVARLNSNANIKIKKPKFKGIEYGSF